MSLPVWIAVGLIGGLGALVRFGMDGLIADAMGGEFPWGTFAVNASGAFLLGLLAGLRPESTVMVLAGTAGLGSYTTFSTWMLESHRLGENGEMVALAVNLLLPAFAGLAAVAIGWSIGSRL